VSAITGLIYQIPDVEQIQTQKRDDGSTGSFSFTTPLIQAYDAASGQARYPRILPYAAVAGPMDLIAIYGWRVSVTQSGAPSADGNPFVDTNNFNPVNYGDASPNYAATVKLLGTPACIMIGMVDSARTSQGVSGQRATFTVSGSDLTKCLDKNDTTIPDASLAGQGGAGPTESNPGFFGLASIQLSKAKSGPIMLTEVLDLLVTKDLNALKTIGGAQAKLPSAEVVAAYKAFGYPWRNFIRTDALDYSYLPLTAQNYPTYTPQMGSVWATCLELRNPPLSRMFVSEIGQLIFDDAFAAWTSTSISGIVGPEDLRDFDSGFNDDNLVTFVSCIPGRAVGTNANIAASKGGFLPGTGFVNGIAAASNASAAHINIYGYRYGQFTSMYDITYSDAQKRQKYVLQAQNNLFSANAVVRGNAIFRVGQKYQFNVDTGRPESTNAVWYVEGVSHSMTYGDDWTTTLSLRYPQNSNFGTDYYPS
jgi:hypothetical protein